MISFLETDTLLSFLDEYVSNQLQALATPRALFVIASGEFANAPEVPENW